MPGALLGEGDRHGPPGTHRHTLLVGASSELSKGKEVLELKIVHPPKSGWTVDKGGFFFVTCGPQSRKQGSAREKNLNHVESQRNAMGWA